MRLADICNALVVLAVLIFVPHGADGAEPKIVAYVPNWTNLEGLSERIDYDRVTHLNIAFENPTNERGELSFHRGNAGLIAKAHERDVKVLVSIGGGAAATDKSLQARYFDLISDSKRAAFAKSLADYVTRHEFDGLDVDIEGPSINKDYGPFIAELAEVLKPNGKLLTAALSQGYGGKNVPDATFEHFDWINIMAYDAAGPWNPQAPGQHSSLDFAKRSVNDWLERGLPKSKAVLGVPFYGYGFGDRSRRGGYAYAEIVAKYPGAESADQAGDTIWYNGIPTIKAKTAYVIEQDLAGIMIWSLNQDAAGEMSLLKAIAETYVTDAKECVKKSSRNQ